MITLKQKPVSETAPLFLLSKAETVVSGGSSADGSAVDDVEISEVTGASSWVRSVLSVGENVSLQNLTPDRLSMDSLPSLNRISGTCGEIKISTPAGISKILNIDFEHISSGTSILPRGYVVGSPTKHCWDLIESELASEDLGLFSSYSHSAQSYSLNGSCWATGWDFSGVSVWNSRSNGFQRPITAITRRHCWGAWHFRLEIGDAVRFRRPDGTIDTHTVVGRIPGQNFSPVVEYHENESIVDMCVYTLDRDLHESISVYSIGGSWITKIVSVPEDNREIDAGYGFRSWSASTAYVAGGLLRMNRNREVSICPTAGCAVYAVETANSQDFEGQTIPIWAWWYRLFNSLPVHLSPAFDAWFLSIVSGDSGSPVFAPVSTSDLVLVTVLTATTGGMMPNADVLNKLILVSDSVAGVSTGYTVTVAPDPTA